MPRKSIPIGVGSPQYEYDFSNDYGPFENGVGYGIATWLSTPDRIRQAQLQQHQLQHQQAMDDRETELMHARVGGYDERARHDRAMEDIAGNRSASPRGTPPKHLMDALTTTDQGVDMVGRPTTDPKKIVKHVRVPLPKDQADANLRRAGIDPATRQYATTDDEDGGPADDEDAMPAAPAAPAAASGGEQPPSGIAGALEQPGMLDRAMRGIGSMFGPSYTGGFSGDSIVDGGVGLPARQPPPAIIGQPPSAPTARSGIMGALADPSLAVAPDGRGAALPSVASGVDPAIAAEDQRLLGDPAYAQQRANPAFNWQKAAAWSLSQRGGAQPPQIAAPAPGAP